MKKWGFVFLTFVVGYAVWIFISGGHSPASEPIERSIETLGKKDEDKEVEERSLFSYKDLSAEEVLGELGEPDRREPSAYGYEWWVFKKGSGRQLQLGLAQDQVVTGVIFHKDDGVVNVGDSYDQLDKVYDFARKVRLDSEGAYTFELTEADVNERPVISINQQWSAQLYFDQVTETVSAIRLIRNDFLLKHQPYKLIYRGTLPLEERLDEKEWEAVQEGTEAQILDMTNILRAKYGVSELEPHQEASHVAFLHSEDMDQQNYFSHYSKNGDGLKERLQGVAYIRAGENIAAQYTDALDAMHGWLNSPGHRKALLDQDYTHIGIGVHQKYYTQNFLKVP